MGLQLDGIRDLPGIPWHGSASQHVVDGMDGHLAALRLGHIGRHRPVQRLPRHHLHHILHHDQGVDAHLRSRMGLPVWNRKDHVEFAGGHPRHRDRRIAHSRGRSEVRSHGFPAVSHGLHALRCALDLGPAQAPDHGTAAQDDHRHDEVAGTQHVPLHDRHLLARRESHRNTASGRKDPIGTGRARRPRRRRWRHRHLHDPVRILPHPQGVRHHPHDRRRHQGDHHHLYRSQLLPRSSQRHEPSGMRRRLFGRRVVQDHVSFAETGGGQAAARCSRGRAQGGYAWIACAVIVHGRRRREWQWASSA
mmetsp:Transcript_732/g.2085  ORF Transcript_732/g.2085 Transcript_732/m.2085 type:complete len:306 (-) Transcript_732:1113-2030(-)